ncbi:MAG: energy-coupling factor transporter ATPase [Ruminococcaceae bacterium]|nr:energy-coupling factor transporter ATPase [Oscillospiraceae bacterium]
MTDENKGTPIVSLKNINFAYPGDEDTPPVPVLHDLSLDVHEGEFVAVLGHNGSGKSTLAKLICMVLSPDSGSVIVQGKDLCGDEITEKDIYAARRDIGLVFQNPDNQLVATIVEEDVAFGCENLGIPSKEIRIRVDEALAAVGMSDYARSTVYKLSGGQKQRVAIAGALAMKRRLIVFDESTAMLDPSGRREVMKAVERLNKEDGVTVIFITHYMNEAAMADRVVVMDRGRIVMDGSPRDVFTNVSELREIGLDVPQTTELLYMLKCDGYDVSLDAITVDECTNELKRLTGKFELNG